MTPRRSLIIFDEVQKCPCAREAIKALVADHRFDYLETGSLISIKKNVEGILIPSEEDGIDMYPMAQMLKAAGHELFFYSNYDKEEAENRMQVDFLVQKEVVTSRHNISPIEVKSGSGYTLTSIQKCIKKFGQYLSTPYVLHTKDVEQKDSLLYLPLYMTGLL